MTFKPIDPKRDEFRRYLERNGVIETLTKVFVRIVKERPENPMEYLRTNLGDALHEEDTLAYLRNEADEARNEVQRLRNIIQNVSPHTLTEYDREKQQQQHQQEQVQQSIGALTLNEGEQTTAPAEVALNVKTEVIEETPPGVVGTTNPQAIKQEENVAITTTIEQQQQSVNKNVVVPPVVVSVPVVVEGQSEISAVSEGGSKAMSNENNAPSADNLK